MLSLGKFPTQVQHNPVRNNPISQNFGFPYKPVFSFSSNSVNPLNIRAFFRKKTTGLCSNALKTKRKGDFNLAEVEGSDDFDDNFMDIDGGEFEVDDDEMVVPLKNMKKWLENRPRGFGEGKVYDTSIEDKLMEEIEQSREAQLANINKLKSNSIGSKSNPKQEITKLDKASMHIPDGIRVRLVNLPKKKNIHKDLRLTFKGVPGILNIVPVVSGNEKTRDPVCKGLAFIDFQDEDEAKRFVENFSGKRVSFGKVQKQIKCDVLNSKLPKPARDQSVKEVDHTPPQAVLNSDYVFDAGFDMDVSPFNSEEESDSSEHDYEDEKHISSAQWQDDEEIKATSNTNNSNFVEEQQVTEELAINSLSSRKHMQNDRKVAPKTKKDKIVKLNIPGSAKRLKIREKAVLTGVFSKYGANATSSIKDE